MRTSLIVSLLILLSLDVNTAQSQESSIVTTGPENGTLLIIGGRASDIFYEKFMDLVGGPETPIVVIPTAITSAEINEERQEQFKQGFINRGFTNVTVLHTRDREVSNSDEFTAPIKAAKGVWFSGGRQWRHADSYLNTKAHEAFHELLDRGGVIAGSSAGATIQGSYLARGDTGGNTLMMGDHEEGLNFLTNVAIDQHLFARNRQFDLFEILEHKPELLGIGLDEDTGIIVKGQRFSVFGNSYVAMYDGTKWSAERNEIKKLESGAHDFYVLKQGDQYDLTRRKVVEFEDRAFIEPSKDDLKNYQGLYQSEDEDGIRHIRVFVKKGKLMTEQLWNNNQRQLLIENDKEMITEGSNLLMEFQIKNNKVTGFFIPRINVFYTKIIEE